MLRTDKTKYIDETETGSAPGEARASGNRSPRPALGRFSVVALVAAFILAFHNLTFWQKLWDYSGGRPLFAAATAVALFALMAGALSLVALPRLFKPVAIAAFLIAAASSWFVDRFGVLIDRSMLASALETTRGEAGELMTVPFFVHMALTGLLPAVLLAWVRIKAPPLRRALPQNIGAALAAVLVAGAVVLPNYGGYASLFRAHRDLAKSLHPSAPISAATKLVERHFKGGSARPLQPVAVDARQKPAVGGKRRPHLTVLVVGETARAESFSLNGYERETNPGLKARNVLSFTNASSCGTATETSVPCMFSLLGRAAYATSVASHTENILDVLKRAGLQLAWFDNNTGSKHQADRIPYFHLAESGEGPYCGEEGCFDEVLVEKMADFVKTMPDKDTLIVLHQLGSHGPAYWRRVPDRYKRFLPECRSSDLDTCSREEIVNAYDNTILYTDHVLSRLVDFLQSQESRFDTAMIYVSDHGESTGENGVYLHGLPYLLAPESQTHIPLLVWLSKGYADSRAIDLDCMRNQTKKAVSHDNLFHSLLEIERVDTADYDSGLDMFEECHG